MENKKYNKLLPGQVLIVEKERGINWVCDVSEEEYEYLSKFGAFNEDENLVLPLPFIASIKRFSPVQILDNVEKYVKEVAVPNLKMEAGDRTDIDLDDLSSATNEQLEQYLAVFGGYKSYLESQLSVIESKKGVLEAGFEEGLNKMYYQMEQKYHDYVGRKPNKEALRGEALAENSQLKNIRQELIEAEAIYNRVRGLRDAYNSAFNTVSRIVALRASGKDQV